MTMQDGVNLDTGWGSEAGVDQESRRRRQKIMSLIRGRIPLMIAAALVLATVGGLVGYFSERDLYMSVGRFQIDPVRPDASGRAQVPPMWAQQVATWFALIDSPQVVDLAMQRNEWQQVARSRGVNLSPEQFARRNSVRHGRDSNIATVAFEAEEPAVAMAGIDATMTAYAAVFEEMEKRSDAELYRILQDHSTALERTIEGLERQKQGLVGGLGTLELRPQLDASFKRLIQYQADLAAIDRHIRETQDGQPRLQNLSVNELIALDPTLSALDQHRTTVARDIERMRLDGLHENHPHVRRTRSALQVSEQQIADRVEKLRSGQVAVGGPENTMEQLRVRRQELQSQISELEGQTQAMGKRLLNAQELENRIQARQRELIQTQNQLETMDIDRLISGRLSVVSRGSEPRFPANAQSRIRKAATGAIGGVGLGAGLVLLLGFFDPRLRHIEDAQADLPDARVLGVLPTLPADLTDPEQAALAAHGVHHIRTLLQIGREHSGNVFAITGPASGSGKTSMTVALGLSFAASGNRTLLIDADLVGTGLTRRMGFVIRPRLGQILERKGEISEPQIQDALRVSRSTGSRIGEALVDLGYLTAEQVERAASRQQRLAMGLLDACGEHKLDECIVATGIPNLSLMPAGAAVAQQAGTLSPSAMRRLIHEARKHYDTVLVDTGPLLGSLEASLASSEADAALLVISRGDQRPMIQRCVEHLQSVGGKLAGMVLNHAHASDIARTSYHSGSVSQGTSERPIVPSRRVDPDTSARFGPLGTAVASYATGADDDADDDALAAAGSGASNGHSNGNGHPYHR